MVLTNASERSDRISSWEPFLTASSAASQSLFNAFSKEPSMPLLISKNVGNTCGFKYESFSNDSSSPSFNTGLDNITCFKIYHHLVGKKRQQNHGYYMTMTN